MNDKEIVKALECCIKVKTLADCKNIGCPALTSQGCYYFLRTDEYCEGVIFIEIIKDALDLINRLQAENERLTTAHPKTIESIKKMRDKAKAEAYKEFAERLKKKYKPYVILGSEVAEIEIDNLLKEMAGENNETKTF